MLRVFACTAASSHPSGHALDALPAVCCDALLCCNGGDQHRIKPGVKSPQYIDDVSTVQEMPKKRKAQHAASGCVELTNQSGTATASCSGNGDVAAATAVASSVTPSTTRVGANAAGSAAVCIAGAERTAPSQCGQCEPCYRCATLPCVLGRGQRRVGVVGSGRNHRALDPAQLLSIGVFASPHGGHAQALMSFKKAGRRPR